MSNQSVLKTVISGDKSGITDKKRVLTRKSCDILIFSKHKSRRE